jgi:hypothetical protein
MAQAILFRMPYGFPGDITRANATVEPVLLDPTNPPTQAGQAVLMNPATDGVRAVLTTDTAITSIYGITVRSFPFQAQSGTNFGAQGIGAAGLPTAPVDINRRGYQLVSVVGTPAKGDPVFVWVAAPTGQHVTGGFEAVASGTSTIQLDSKTTWNSGPDASGNAEIAFNI